MKRQEALVALRKCLGDEMADMLLIDSVKQVICIDIEI